MQYEALTALISLLSFPGVLRIVIYTAYVLESLFSFARIYLYCFFDLTQKPSSSKVSALNVRNQQSRNKFHGKLMLEVQVASTKMLIRARVEK